MSDINWRAVGVALIVTCFLCLFLNEVAPKPVSPEEERRLVEEYRRESSQRKTTWHRRPGKTGKWLRVESGWLYDDGIFASPVFVPEASDE